VPNLLPNYGMLIVCRKNLSQSDLTDCKIITIEGEEKVFLVGSHGCFQCFEIQEWEGCIVKIQSPRSHKKQMPS
jgi:hypothetical protein